MPYPQPQALLLLKLSENLIECLVFPSGIILIALVVISSRVGILVTLEVSSKIPTLEEVASKCHNYSIGFTSMISTTVPLSPRTAIHFSGIGRDSSYDPSIYRFVYFNYDQSTAVGISVFIHILL